MNASGFIRKYSQEFKKGVRGLSRGALLALDGYDWPGNVRGLENIIERSVALATRLVIGLDDLPLDLAMNEVAQGRAEGAAPLTLKDARDRFEQAYVAAGAGARGPEPEPGRAGAGGAPEHPDRAAGGVGLPNSSRTLKQTTTRWSISSESP